jgi:hypothetical protein
VNSTKDLVEIPLSSPGRLLIAGFMHLILQETLLAIETERRDQFNQSFLLVDQLLAVYGEEELVEQLYRDIPAACPWEVVADLLAILIWSTSDNGAAITQVTDQWLVEGADLRKIRIGLHLDTYPFLERARMEAILTGVAIQHPEVAAKCHELIESRSGIDE